VDLDEFIHVISFNEVNITCEDLAFVRRLLCLFFLVCHLGCMVTSVATSFSLVGLTFCKTKLVRYFLWP
jgi:hypothetical protein